MNEMRKLMEAIKLIEDFDDEEHYSIKDATIERFRGRRIIVTDLYDGDIYGILDKKHGPRFMISAPLWRDEVGPGEVMDDEVEVSSPTFDIDEKDEAFLKQWYMESVNEDIEETQVKNVDEAYDEETSFSDAGDMVKYMLRELQKVEQNTHQRIREINSEPLLMAESDMVLDHYTETLDQISNLVKRMENAYVNTPGR